MAVNTRYITHSQWRSHAATELTYPDGRQVASGYDPLYRRNSISETSGSTHIASWQFFGQRTATVSLGNGMVTSYMNNAQTRSAIQLGQPTPAWGSISTDQLGYDGAGRLIGKRHFNSGGMGATVTVGLTSAYDKSSNKLFERALHAESRSSLYDSYDSMDRLLDYERGVLASGGSSITTAISLPGTNQEQAYNLDGLGNWTTTTITPEGGSPATQSRTHNKLNEVTQYGVSPASTPVLYDHGNNSGSGASRGNGNIADDGIRTYAYDAFNRLTTIKRKSDGATIGQYTYDAMGRRIRKIVSNGGLPNDSAMNGTTDYLYDGQQIIEDRSVSGSTQTTIGQYIWGQYIDELIQKKLPATSGAPDYYLLSDLLYRSGVLTDNSTTIVEAYDTDAYGNTICYSAAGTGGNWFADDATSTGTPRNCYIFTGRQFDPETQIYFYYSRYFSPSLGRFISRDQFDLQRDAAQYSLSWSANSKIFIVQELIALSNRLSELKILLQFIIQYATSELASNAYLYCGDNPTARLDPFGLAFKNCSDALKQLEKALKNAEKDLEDIIKFKTKGSPFDKGHLKEYLQRQTEIDIAMAQVIKYCGCDGASAAAKALLAKAKDALATLDSAFHQLLIALSNRQFIRSVQLAIQTLAALLLLLSIVAALIIALA